MPSTILINAATGAASPEFTVSPEQQRFTVRASGLAGAETITLQAQVGGAFRNENEDDVAITLTATAQTVILNAPGRYKLVKGSTAGAVTVEATY